MKDNSTANEHCALPLLYLFLQQRPNWGCFSQEMFGLWLLLEIGGSLY